MLLPRYLLSATFVAASAFAFGQETLTTASVTGRVIDPSGAVLADTSLTVQELATNQTRTVQTDDRGRFRLPFLPIGRYRFTAAPAGFQTITRELELTVGAAFDLTLQVPLAQASSSINVQAQAPIIEENRSQISETIRQAEVSQLPYSGRNYLDLALLAPGVSPTNTNSVQTFAETSPVIGQGYSINSQRNFSNSFVVDGLSANDDAAGLAGNSYGLDVVREFQVVTSGGQAEFGRALGGYFNIVTRSGTNDLHGTVYGFLRNQRLNAQNALSRNRLPLTQGQYGASLSGPIRRDRTFLFGNYEGRRLNTNGVVTINPTQATQINTRLQTVGWTGPRLSVGTGSTTLFPTTVHTDHGFLRADHRFNDHDQFTLRYSFYGLDSTNARGVGALSDVSFGTKVRDQNHTLALSNVVALSAHTFNETRGQFTYDNLEAPPNEQTAPAVTVTGVATFGRFSSSPTARLNYLYEVVDNLVLQRGAHTIKTGVDVLVNDDTITFPRSIRGAYTFASLAAFLSGTYQASGFTQSFGTPSIQQLNPNLGLYVQDEWKASSSLTVNAGLRYDLQFLKTIHTDTNNLSPRIGFAWSPFAAKKTVVRGSFGLFYDRIPLRALANALLSANNTTDPTQGRLITYSYSATDPGAPVFPNVSTTPLAGARLAYSTMNPNVQNAYSQQMSLGIEQEILSSTTLGISYQHTRGLKLLSSINRNINPDGTRPDPTRGNITPYDSLFDSYYDGLAVSFVRRPGRWGSARVSYTWSKAINNVGEFFFSTPINNFDLSIDRSRSDDDQRHRLVFDATLHSSMSRATTFTGHLTHGWQLGGILQYYSRLPFNILAGGTTKQLTNQRPCMPGSGLSLTPSGVTNACTLAQKGFVLGRNTGAGFDFFNLNTRLSRSFAFSERWHLETIAEAFNVLNHRNDMIPNGTWGTNPYPNGAGNASFGQATAVGDPRSVQLAARINF